MQHQGEHLCRWMHSKQQGWQRQFPPWHREVSAVALAHVTMRVVRPSAAPVLLGRWPFSE
jgi:hypothetical protein